MNLLYTFVGQRTNSQGFLSFYTATEDFYEKVTKTSAAAREKQTQLWPILNPSFRCPYKVIPSRHAEFL